MSIQEQLDLKEKYYGEAMRYMDNATECLQKAKKEAGYYNDRKYVRMACGTAYSGALVALDGFLQLKGIKPKGKERKSIEFYQSNVTKIDKKMLNVVNNAYQILHLSGYYDGVTNAKVVKEGFEEAYKIIGKLRVESN